MAAVRCVVRGLWINHVLSARICTRLTAQPASLFSSESGKILTGLKLSRIQEWPFAHHNLSSAETLDSQIS